MESIPTGRAVTTVRLSAVDSDTSCSRCGAQTGTWAATIGPSIIGMTDDEARASLGEAPKLCLRCASAWQRGEWSEQ